MLCFFETQLWKRYSWISAIHFFNYVFIMHRPFFAYKKKYSLVSYFLIFKFLTVITSFCTTLWTKNHIYQSGEGYVITITDKMYNVPILFLYKWRFTAGLPVLYNPFPDVDRHKSTCRSSHTLLQEINVILNTLCTPTNQTASIIAHADRAKYSSPKIYATQYDRTCKGT